MRTDFRSEYAGKRLFSLFDSTKYKKVNMFRKHRHTEIEFGYILSGEGRYCLNEQEYRATAGDMFLIRPNEQHCIPTIYSDRLVSFNIHIEPYYLWEICSEYLSQEAIEALINGDVRTQRLTGMGHYMTAFMELCRQPEDNRFEIKRRMVAFLGAVADELAPRSNRTESGAMRNLPAIQSAIQCMQNRLAEPITLEDIAKSANLSKSRFSVVFKQATGVSPYDFLLIQRVECSLALLRDTHKAIATIAGECGFSNLSNYNRKFKEITGVSPREYRRMKQLEAD